MKKLISTLLLFITFSAFAVDVNIGEKVTSAGSTEVTVNLVGLLPATNSYHSIYVTVDAGNSGTIQFSVGRAIVASDNAWPAGSKIIMTVANSSKPLRYKASAASQSFVVNQ